MAQKDTTSASLGRSSARISVLTLLSRLTGLLRVVVATNVLRKVLGDVYQSTNSVPTLLFELLAAGALQAALIPQVVRMTKERSGRNVEEAVGTILGALLLTLSAIAIAGMIFATPIMHFITASVRNPELRQQQIALGRIFLWFFLPQIPMYAFGLVATGVLNARNRFGVPVAAPMINNVIVIVSYIIFDHLHTGAPLVLSTSEKWVLGGGTTLGVLVFTAAPVIATYLDGFRMRLSVSFTHPELRTFLKNGFWAALFLGGTQLLLLAVIVLSQRYTGGVVAWQFSYAFFMLPYALVGLPVLTALFPSMTHAHLDADASAFGKLVQSGMRVIVAGTLPLVAIGAAIAPIAVPLVIRNSVAVGVARIVPPMLLGIVGYGCFLFLMRALYATDSYSLPAKINTVAVAITIVVMTVLSRRVTGTDVIVVLAWIHSAMYLAVAFVAAVVLHHRGIELLGKSVRRHHLVAVVGAALSFVVLRLIVENAHPQGDAKRLLLTSVLAILGLFLYFGVLLLSRIGIKRTFRLGPT